MSLFSCESSYFFVVEGFRSDAGWSVMQGRFHPKNPLSLSFFKKIQTSSSLLLRAERNITVFSSSIGEEEKKKVFASFSLRR